MTTNAKTNEPEHAHLATKAPTAYHKRMAAWMTNATGVQVDAKQVQIVTALRATYVATDENQRDLAKRRAEAAKRKAEKDAAKKAAAAKKIAELQAILDA